MNGQWKKYIARTAITALVIVISVFLVYALLPVKYMHYSEYRVVKNYIHEIDLYYEKHAAYPSQDNQTIVPSNEFDNPFFYENINSDGYRVGFRIGFDEIYFYDSSTQTWNF